MLRVTAARLGRTSQAAPLIEVQMDEEDLDYLIEVMEGEQLRTPRDGAPPDYLAELREAKARLVAERKERSQGPGLIIRAHRQ